jgi:hypothetical protein
VSAARPERPEPGAGPSGPGTVVLELGPGAGALILMTPAELDGAEIEVSRLDGPDAGHRTHSLVRPRHVSGGTVHAAVYPDLPPGEYAVLGPAGEAVASVTVVAGAAATARWPTGKWPAGKWPAGKWPAGKVPTG